MIELQNRAIIRQSKQDWNQRITANRHNVFQKLFMTFVVQIGSARRLVPGAVVNDGRINKQQA